MCRDLQICFRQKQIIQSSVLPETSRCLELDTYFMSVRNDVEKYSHTNIHRRDTNFRGETRFHKVRFKHEAA